VSGAATTLATTEACFESSTGFLLRTRALNATNGSCAGIDAARTASDVAVKFTHDSSGNTTSEEYFGGDNQTISTSGALCGLTLPSCGAYRIDHTYQYGSRKTSRYVDTTSCPGTAMSFYTLDLTIDQNTGRPSAARDTAGVQTNLVFDPEGRLTWQKPQTANPVGDAWMEYVYTNSSGTNPARIDAKTHPNNNTSTILAQSSYVFDPYGRLVTEKTLLPSSSWNQRLTTFDSMDRKTSVSEWQPDGTSAGNIKKTQYTLDLFGRPTTISPPDGTAHNVTLSYQGARQVSRTVKVATAVGTESNSVTTELYDQHGRLVTVTEPSGSGGTNVSTTTYTYDVGNRLKGVSTTSGSTTQSRVLTYDGRGFLTSEQLPEVGSSGNGSITYSAYDARGHAWRIADGANDLTYVYDKAERLAQLKRTSDNQLYKELTYATANGSSDWRNGKLVAAKMHNRYDGSTDFSVEDDYVYGERQGRVSQRQTKTRTEPSGTIYTFTQGFTWNDLGKLATQSYPDSDQFGDTTRSVSYTYTNGFLTAVPSFATSISYHPNMMVNAVAHANGVTDTQGVDPNAMPRPASIATSGATQNWSSGTYAYDGAGNIKAVGQDYYIYDKVSRVVEGAPRAAAYKQRYTYDAFGNITKIETLNGSTWDPKNTTTSGTTNRIQATCPSPINVGDMAA
jgi:hypothetical protein